jgi:hypothetical protein
LSEWRLLNPDGKEIVVPVSGRYLANNADVLRTTAPAGWCDYCRTIRHRSRDCTRSIRPAGISLPKCEALWISWSIASAASRHGIALEAASGLVLSAIGRCCRKSPKRLRG